MLNVGNCISTHNLSIFSLKECFCYKVNPYHKFTSKSFHYKFQRTVMALSKNLRKLSYLLGKIQTIYP